MIIEKLTLYNFKNYLKEEFVFSPSINLIIGKNGSGKTNLLDAIHYLSLTKSAFNFSDAQTLKKGENAFSISSSIKVFNKLSTFFYSYQSGSKKILKVNKVEYEKLSSHIGKLPVVLIAPNDTSIIREGSEERRRFFDTIICQLDPEYLQYLLKYTHNLKQRNALLKSTSHLINIDQHLVEYYNAELIKYGKYIHRIRQDFVENFLPVFKKLYFTISNGNELPDMDYVSQLHGNSFETLLSETLAKDFLFQRTTTGIHKDDYQFKIDNNVLKNFGSQGQQKSFLICLKLTQYEVIKEAKGFKPVLLLDDIFDKLDDLRIKKLLELVGQNYFGQIFITDARTERSDSYLETLPNDFSIFKIENGKQI